MMGILIHGIGECINPEKQFILSSKIENMCIKSLEISYPGNALEKCGHICIRYMHKYVHKGASFIIGAD